MSKTQEKPRRTRRYERTRNQILDAARVMFLEQEFQSVKMEAIAESVLLSRVTLYQYFSSKMDLFGNILSRDMASLVDEMRGAKSGTASASENLVAIADAYLHFFARHPEYFKKFSFYFLPGRQMDLPDDLIRDLEAKLLQGIDLLEECIVTGVESGEFTPCDAEFVALAYWNHLMGYAYASVTRFAERQKLQAKKIADTGSRVFVSGLMARS